MDMDIVIPTRNRGDRIKTVIESIRENTYDHFTLWVIDQSDNDNTESVVRQFAELDKRIRYFRTSSRGANFARNEGALFGNGKIICFVDDDCRVAPTWLAEIRHEFDQDEKTWLMFGRVLTDDEYRIELPPGTKNISKAIPAALKNSPQRKVYKGNRFDLGFGHGANMAFRRSCYLRTKGFDGFIGAGGPLGTWDERDIGYRVLCQPDGQIVYTPRPLVYHQPWRGWTDVQKAYRNYAIGTGAAVSKYVRCGDWGSIYFLAEWVIDQGARQVLSGLLKWRSWQKVVIGLLQIVYPWVGLVQGMSYPVRQKDILYTLPRDAQSAAANNLHT